MEKGNPGEPCQFVAAAIDWHRFTGIAASAQLSGPAAGTSTKSQAPFW
jgi:hypothetical protein